MLSETYRKTCNAGIDLQDENTRWDRKFKHVLRFGCYRSKDDRCINWREETNKKKKLYLWSHFFLLFSDGTNIVCLVQDRQQAS